MKVGVISDIHGNHYALEAVLKTAKKEGIEKIKAIGIGEDETPWELESPEALRKLYKNITGKKI